MVYYFKEIGKDNKKISETEVVLKIKNYCEIRKFDAKKVNELLVSLIINGKIWIGCGMLLYIE